MAQANVWGRAAGGWSALAKAAPPVGFLDALLRGTGQVMFQNHPLTGLLFLVGVFVNSWLLGVAGVVGLASSTAAALLLGADRALVRAGLFGFNGILVGIGLAFFLEFQPWLAAYIVLGAAVSTVAMMALVSLLGPREVPALTAPFVLTTWLLLFGLYQLNALRPTELIAPGGVDPQARVQTELRPLPGELAGAGLTAGNLAHAFLRGVGEVMFQDNLVTGLIFLAAILVNSRIAALMAALGSAVGLLTALALGADGFWVYHGLYGFNSVLCAIALGGVFFVATWQSGVYALVAAVTGAVAMAAVSVALAPLGMPALTAPFVLVTWLFLLPRAGFRVLRPVPLAEVGTPEQARQALRGPRAARPQPA